MLFVNDTDHLFAPDIERGAGGDRGGRRQTQPGHRGKGLLAHKVTRREQRDRGFFADFRNDSESCAPLLKIKDGVRWISLREERLFRLQFDDTSTKTGFGQKDCGIEYGGAERAIPGLLSA